MSQFDYPLATATWDNKEYQALQDVIDSGMFTMGPRVKEFECKFASHMGSRYAVMVNSGSSANLLMIAALFYTKSNPLKAGDEVIVPAVSWSTTYFPLCQYGLKIKFVDIDLETLNYDLDALEQAVTDRTKVILAVNLLGNPNDFIRINSIIDGKDIQLIEDNCESMGATFNGKMAGTFGRLGTFSTFFSHHISTMEGGVIVTDDEEIFHILLSIRSHGWTRHLPKKNLVIGNKSDNLFDESFRFVLPGYNVRPLEMSGALGIEQLKKLPSLIESRRKNGLAFQLALGGHADLMIQSEVGNSSWFGFSLIIRPGSKLTREVLLEKLNNLSIESRPIVAGNFVRNEVCKYFNYEINGKLKNADWLDANGLFVGNQHFDISEMFELLKNSNIF